MNIKVITQNIANNPGDFSAEKLEKLFEDYVDFRKKTSNTNKLVGRAIKITTFTGVGNSYFPITVGTIAKISEGEISIKTPENYQLKYFENYGYREVKTGGYYTHFKINKTIFNSLLRKAESTVITYTSPKPKSSLENKFMIEIN